MEDLEKQIAWIVAPWKANGNVREFLCLREWDTPERISLVSTESKAEGNEYHLTSHDEHNSD